jgi:FkbM family methyltransferase
VHPALAKLRQFVRRRGFDVIRYPSPLVGPAVRYADLMTQLGVSLLVDVGANEGQFVREIRTMGWDGPVRSYEPLSHAFETLRQNAAGDPTWKVFKLALGASPATAQIHIAGNSVSSSLLPMLDTHLRAAPDSGYIGEETVEITTLDDALTDEISSRDRLCVKLDCQGYEGEVLKGAAAALERTAMVVMELSLVDVYEEALRFDEAVPKMRELGFGLTSLDPVFSDPTTKELLQVDGCFVALPDPPVGDRSFGTMKRT